MSATGWCCQHGVLQDVICMPRQALIAACTGVLQAFSSSAMPALSMSQLWGMHVAEHKQVLHAALLALEQEGSIMHLGRGSTACFCLSANRLQEAATQGHTGGCLQPGVMHATQGCHALAPYSGFA